MVEAALGPQPEQGETRGSEIEGGSRVHDLLRADFELPFGLRVTENSKDEIAFLGSAAAAPAVDAARPDDHRPRMKERAEQLASVFRHSISLEWVRPIVLNVRAAFTSIE